MTIGAQRQQIKRVVIPVIVVDVVNVVINRNRVTNKTFIIMYKQNYVFNFLKFSVIPSHAAGVKLRSRAYCLKRSHKSRFVSLAWSFVE